MSFVHLVNKRLNLYSILTTETFNKEYMYMIVQSPVLEMLPCIPQNMYCLEKSRIKYTLCVKSDNFLVDK
jgi:hypothetical protein